MKDLDLNKKINGMTLGDLVSTMNVVVKEALKSDFEKINKKFENLEIKLNYLKREIETIKHSQEFINYENSSNCSHSSSISKPLNSFSITTIFGESITVNSYDKF